MGTQKIFTQEQPAGSLPNKRPYRRFEFLAKDITSVEQAVPVRVFYGTVKVAGIAFTPIFNFKAKKIRAAGGK